MIDMVFKKEVKYGDVLFSEVEVKENYKTLHRLYNMQNDDVCLLECDWEPVV